VIDRARRKEICFQNVRRQKHCVEEALDLVESGRVNPDFMVTHHFPFEQTQKAFDLVDSYADGVVKAMIEFDD
jgi:threonine dehydrogenase-like Zn-dependent dehydrogenase